ncbi:MAG TPA: hypothetical protein VMZ25_02750, partial [Terriglobales bacterium]|nr:hypothetical protein [Terriglobales bacterium]
MKKIMTMAVAMCLTVTMSAFAHDDKKADKSKEITVTGIVTDPMCAKSGDKAKMSNEDCTKRCAKDGKLSLVNDKDGSVWAIENVDAVKGHEGHHVKVMGHANTEAKSFHITSVSMQAGNMGKGDMKHDMHHDKEMKKE